MAVIQSACPTSVYSLCYVSTSLTKQCKSYPALMSEVDVRSKARALTAKLWFEKRALNCRVFMSYKWTTPSMFPAAANSELLE